MAGPHPQTPVPTRRRRPAPPRAARLRAGPGGQLTSMRTALFLLLLLAIAAVPGSIFPQRSIDAARVADLIAEHPTAGPWLDRLGFFEVYSSAWFSAIYLLLFISLVGCVLPRTGCTGRPCARSRRARPAPSRAADPHAEPCVDGEHEDAARAAAREALRGRRFRVHSHDGESRQRRERLPARDRQPRLPPRPLRRHHRRRGRASLRLEGRRDRPGGETFSNTLSSYDTLQPGALGRPGGRSRRSRSPSTSSTPPSRSRRRGAPVRRAPGLHGGRDDDRHAGTPATRRDVRSTTR